MVMPASVSASFVGSPSLLATEEAAEASGAAEGATEEWRARRWSDSSAGGGQRRESAEVRAAEAATVDAAATATGSAVRVVCVACAAVAV